MLLFVVKVAMARWRVADVLDSRATVGQICHVPRRMAFQRHQRES
jgi:hypothetical protein